MPPMGTSFLGDGGGGAGPWAPMVWTGMPRRKSFYHLNFAVAPGGARQDAHYVRATLDEVKGDLANELAHGIGLYLLCWYGATLKLEVFDKGELVKEVNLHPFVEIEIEGYPKITFGQDDEPIGHDFKADDDAEDEDETLTTKLFMGQLEDVTVVRVAWDRMELPKLEEELVAEGDMVTLEGDWREGEELSSDDLRDEGWLPVGHFDTEV